MHISKSKKCFNVRPLAYYFHMKTKMLADFQICISMPLMEVVCASVKLCGWSVNFWNLWWSSSISNDTPTVSLFYLLPTFVSCSLFLVYLFSMTPPTPSFLFSPLLWTYYEHMFQLYICFKNPKRIIIVSSRYLICSIIAITQAFSSAVSKWKPI